MTDSRSTEAANDAAAKVDQGHRGRPAGRGPTERPRALPAAGTSAGPTGRRRRTAIRCADAVDGGKPRRRADGDEADRSRTPVDPAASRWRPRLASLRTALEERTRDLQRVTAEYANYRKRVDRDRALVVEQATGNVIAVLLPVLDDLDRARDHGDLTGPFAAVADQLTAALAKFGLTRVRSEGRRVRPDPARGGRAPHVARRHRADVRRRDAARLPAR